MQSCQCYPGHFREIFNWIPEISRVTWQLWDAVLQASCESPYMEMWSLHRPLTRYVKLRVVHAPGMPGTFSPPPRVSDPDMHHGTCVTHIPWCMSGSLTSGFLRSRWRGKRSRHSRCMRNQQFYVSGKRPIETPPVLAPQALLGNHYGWRPPPTCLGKREFDYLVRHLRKIDINGPAYLRGWFEEDKNTDPSHVVLKFPKFLQDEAKVCDTLRTSRERSPGSINVDGSTLQKWINNI